MHPYTKFLMTGCLGAVLTLAACGDDDSGLTTAEFRDRANTICADGDIEIGEAVGAVFGGEDVGPEQLQAALDTIVSVSRRQMDEISALAAPSSLKDDVAEFVTEGRSGTDAAEAQGLGFFESDGDPWQRTGELAGDLGLDACVGGE